jgi:hypothetical protein
MWTWALTIASLIGVILNIYKDPLCFWIWAFTNAAWAVVDCRKKIYSQSVLMMLYCALAIWGTWAWR